MKSELEELEDILQSEEIILSQYAHNLGSGNDLLEANYRHKKADVERLRARIEELKGHNSAPGEA